MEGRDGKTEGRMTSKDTKTMTMDTLDNSLDQIERGARKKGLGFMVDWKCQAKTEEQKVAFAAEKKSFTVKKMWLDGQGKNVANGEGNIPDDYVCDQLKVYGAHVEDIIMSRLDDKQQTKVRNSAGNDLQLMFHTVKFYYVHKTVDGRMNAEKALRNWTYNRKISMGVNFDQLRALFKAQEVMGGTTTEKQLLEILVTSVPPRGLVSEEIRDIKRAMQNADEGAGELPQWAEATHALESAETAQKKEDKEHKEHELLKEEEEEEDDAEESPEANHAREMRRPSVRRAVKEAYEQGQQSAMSAKHEETCEHCHKSGHTKKTCWGLNPHLNPRARKSNEECYNWRDNKSCRFGDKCRWAGSHN
jgi:hypothetical protein